MHNAVGQFAIIVIRIASGLGMRKTSTNTATTVLHSCARRARVIAQNSIGIFAAEKASRVASNLLGDRGLRPFGFINWYTRVCTWKSCFARSG